MFKNLYTIFTVQGGTAGQAKPVTKGFPDSYPPVPFTHNAAAPIKT